MELLRPVRRELFVTKIVIVNVYFFYIEFDTSRLEMNHVSDMFDKNSRGLIDWKEFIAALRPDWEEKSNHDAQKIHDEVKRLVMLCTCRQKFRVFQVGEGKYRVIFFWFVFFLTLWLLFFLLLLQFGDSQKLRLVRILRSTVMVRVGGGWVALDEFLLKNDPCRGTYFKFCSHSILNEYKETLIKHLKGILLSFNNKLQKQTKML